MEQSANSPEGAFPAQSGSSTSDTTRQPNSNRSSMTVASTCSMRRIKDKLPWRVWLVAVIAFWERAAFWGLTTPWQNYMEHPAHYSQDQTPGALDLGQTMATRIYCAFYICYYITPTLVAPLADSYLGQYTTLVISALLYCCGCIALTVSSVPANLDRGWGLPGLLLAMAFIAIGGGACKAILVPFIADQYEETKPQVKTLKNGEDVVTDYELTLQYIYNLYFWVGNVGSLSQFATVFLERQYGFLSAYALCTGFMVVATGMLIVGKNWYIKAPVKVSVLPKAAKIITCATRHGFKMKRAEPEYQLEHYQATVSWDRVLVLELTRGLQACRVLLAFVVFYICFDQMQNNLISQASQMKLGHKYNDLLPGMNQIGCIVMGALVQECLYPYLHRRRIYISAITRITIGFGLVALSMLYATFVQNMVYSSAPCYDRPQDCALQLSISETQTTSGRPNVWIQAPLYFLIATGEVFAMTTAMEYAYEHSPKDMKVIVQAVNLLVAGLGSASAMALATVARDPWLTYLFAGLTGGMTLTTVIFWLIFRRSRRDGVVPEQSSTDTALPKGTQHVALEPILVATDSEAPGKTAITTTKEVQPQAASVSARASEATLCTGN
ncbi:peptide transporter ptr2 [Coniothyrium glycines]